MNLAESLNLNCACETLQRNELSADIAHMFSAAPVFVSLEDEAALQEAVAALHRVAALPAFRAAALLRRPGTAQHASGPSGAFMGYDFHMSPQGPRLIEINTNAGGAFLNAAALRAHRLCCGLADHRELETAFMQMFRDEWRAQRGEQPLRTVAIVDDAPQAQFLAPEFELARRMFERHDVQAVVADAAALQWQDGRLRHAGIAIDLVYNRLTDFDLAEERHAALRDAYLQGAAVVTPHPNAHAIHADKRNLVSLGDDAQLHDWGATERDREVLRRVVPRTTFVTAQNADELWARRRELFFKPATGYGSKAAYRGDKLTRRVWGDIVAGGFVAQAFVAPSERLVHVGGEPVRLKLDIRAYAYAGRVQLLAARTYVGQTTNLRTPGGGFSPVVAVPSIAGSECAC